MQPCGRNFLGGVVKSVCEEVGVYGKTNHSLRATGTTRLFAANVPEKLIAERTGHRSTDALRMYERTSVKQQETVSSIIASSSPKEFTMSSTASGSCQSQAIERSGRSPLITVKTVQLMSMSPMVVVLARMHSLCMRIMIQ